ncbi:YbaN family protein [Marinobacter lacisalsi]|uniref:Inner membrane protein n=1 Tax=Marinobacter lacisalsi TaxID=475979 RepID=A0ABV8QHC5_9GAMM
MEKTAYRVLAYISLSLGVAGIALPLLPTTPFVLLAAWCASRSSPAFAAWLHEHQTFGPVIRNWRDKRAVPLQAKWLAGAMLLFSWVVLWWSGLPAAALVLTGVFFMGLVAFLFTRPTA